MAIEHMKKVAALVPADSLDRFIAWLHGRSVLHLAQMEEKLPEGYGPPAEPEADVRARATKLEQVMNFCETWGGPRKSFLEGLLSAKTVARPAELRKAANRLSADVLHAEVAELRSRRDLLLQQLSTIGKEYDGLRPFSAIDVPLAGLARLEHVEAALVRLGRRAQEEMEASCPENVAWERLEGDVFWFAFPRAERDEAAVFLASLGAGREEIPAVEKTARERLAVLAFERTELLQDLGRLDRECKEFAEKGEEVELALGYWQSEIHRAEGIEKLARSDRLSIAHGYLPARDLERFTAEVRGRFKGEVLSEEPGTGEAVPVKLIMGKFFRPATLLVKMFGVPDYFSIDPTPFITFTFLLFFGICFSDAFYGLGLMALAAVLMHRFRRQESLRQFFQLFLYAGVSTFLCGALLGSWASDLYKYLGEGNFLQHIREFMFHASFGALPFNALEKPILALVGVIFIGIANQYFGIAMRAWRDWRRGDHKGAVFDGGLWFLYLTGLVILVSALFVDVPASWLWAGAALLAAGAVGLVLTQGRDQESIFARFVVGGVSLYGIMGTYGATSFIGDTLSYSRLLALGLTTGIVGMSFNLLADLTSGVPKVGTALFAGLVILGHTFNFFISIIGAFVHSARLILLEFFGRFYETGGVRYEPFGFRSERVEVASGGA